MLTFGTKVRKVNTGFSHCKFCKENLYAQIYVTYTLPKNKNYPDKYHSLCLICKRVYYFSDEEAQKYFISDDSFYENLKEVLKDGMIFEDIKSTLHYKYKKFNFKFRKILKGFKK